MIKIAIIGATGFIGRHLCQNLIDSYEIKAISRRPPEGEFTKAANYSWTSCDLHNLKELERAIAGCDMAIYLIHSMLPNARLNQGTFQDFDLILADNFGRAAKTVGMKHVLFLSGLSPNEAELSPHLDSRLEVEDCLRSHIPNLTVLRAGLIIGPLASSFTIVERLVRRLPMMLCPVWTRQTSSSVALEDVIHGIRYCLGNKDCFAKTYDLGPLESVTYLQIMKTTAKELGLRRLFFLVPWLSLGLSRLWVSLVAGAPKSLVYPLVKSMVHVLQVRPSAQLQIPGHQYKSLTDSIHDTITKEQSLTETSPHAYRKSYLKSKRSRRQVRSIQRLSFSSQAPIRDLANHYFRWINQFLPFFVRVKQNEDTVDFLAGPLPIKLISFKFSHERSQEDRVLFYITGGLLVSSKNQRGRLEFRSIKDSDFALVAIHDFIPRLPWYIYSYTQAPFHAWTMRRFQKNLIKGTPTS